MRFDCLVIIFLVVDALFFFFVDKRALSWCYFEFWRRMTFFLPLILILTLEGTTAHLYEELLRGNAKPCPSNHHYPIIIQTQPPLFSVAEI